MSNTHDTALAEPTNEAAKGAWWDAPAAPPEPWSGRWSPEELDLLAFTPLLREALLGGETVQNEWRAGRLAEGTSPTELLDLLTTGGRIVAQIGERGDTFVIGWPGGLGTVVVIEEDGKPARVRFSAHVADPERLGALREVLDKHVVDISDAEQSQLAHVIIKGRDGLTIQPMGVAALPLERGNYTSDALDSFDVVVADLQTATPNGRITLIEGVAGTGKTFFIRGIMAATRRVTYVIVPPAMIAELGSPELLPLLIEAREGFDGPTALLLEDADMALVKRMGDNMATISSLLNLGDGLMGGLLDVRIIATTNAKKIEIDAAVLRPGRLSRRIEIDALDADHADAILHRLRPGDGKPVHETRPTLARVYQLAREHGWTPEETYKPRRHRGRARRAPRATAR